jgi:hypothetical protein
MNWPFGFFPRFALKALVSHHSVVVRVVIHENKLAMCTTQPVQYFARLRVVPSQSAIRGELSP